MKAATRIKNAAKSMYDAYTDYSRVVQNVPVIPNIPKVQFMAGNPKDGKAGWVVDGRLYPVTADQLVAHFEERARYWQERTQRFIATGMNGA